MVSFAVASEYVSRETYVEAKQENSRIDTLTDKGGSREKHPAAVLYSVYGRNYSSLSVAGALPTFSTFTSKTRAELGLMTGLPWLP